MGDKKNLTRGMYLERMLRARGEDKIKIVTGLHCCGKSFLAATMMKLVNDNERSAKFIYIDLGGLANESMREQGVLGDYIRAHYERAAKNYLFIDEVEYCPDFVSFVLRLYESRKFDIYISSSNNFLSDEKTRETLDDKCVTLDVFPLSFAEYVASRNGGGATLDEYAADGGMPGTLRFGTEGERMSYLRNIYHAFIERDIRERHAIKNFDIMHRLIMFLIDNIGISTSMKQISNIMKNAGVKTNHVTINNYIRYLLQSFLFYRCDRLDLRTGKVLESGSKFYIADTGLCHAMQGVRTGDEKKFHENIVYLELLRRGYDVHVAKLYQKEIDFIATRQGETSYYQMAGEGADGVARAAKLLSGIRDNHKKFVIAETGKDEYIKDDIHFIDIERFLSDGKEHGI